MNDFIMYVLGLLGQGLFLVVLAMLVSVVVLVGVRLAYKRRGQLFPWKKAVAALFLVGWLSLTLYATLFRSESGFQQWNFHLFMAWKEAWNLFSLQAWMNVVLNIAMFIPLGVLLPILFRIFRRWYWTLLAGFAASFGIEMLQLVCQRGIFDVDDLFTNTLGAITGWGLVMAVFVIVKRPGGWKKQICGALSVPVALILVFAAIAAVYYIKPYGNLNGALYRADLENIEWAVEFTPENASAEAEVYQANSLDKSSSEAFAREFAQNTGIRFEDTYYYDRSIIFADHSTGDFLNLNQQDGSWEYSIGEHNVPVLEGSVSDIDPEDIKEILRSWNITLPEEAQFSIESNDGMSRGIFSADFIPSGDGVFYGTLTCYFEEENGKTQITRIYNHIVPLVPYAREDILSPAQALDTLCSGRSFYGHLLEFYAVDQVQVLSCELEWITDTKGFYQPVYVFNLELAGQGPMTDYVAALD